MKFTRLLLMLVLSSLIILPFRLSAAPGTLADNPLFLQIGVQPNIFFVLDDSGSMDWEVVKSRGAEQEHPGMPNGGNLDFTPENGHAHHYHDNEHDAHSHNNHTHSGSDHNGHDHDHYNNHTHSGNGNDHHDEPFAWWTACCTDEDDENEEENERRELCVGYNVLMYDPDVVYTSWRGKDHNGVAFQDQDPTSAHVNPYTGGANTGDCGVNYANNGNGRTCDLVAGFGNNEGAFYYPWNDQAEGEAGHNVYEDDECDTTPVFVSTLSAADQTNFANWFSYYRKREYVMKRAVSQIIEDSQVRMGLATINANPELREPEYRPRHDRVLESALTTSNRWRAGTPITDIDTDTVRLDSSAQERNKAILMDNLLAVNSGGGTPLRLALHNTGRYFQGDMNNGDLFGFTPPDDTDSANGSSPILKGAKNGQCQQNFALLFSDGYRNGDGTGLGNTDIDGTGPYDGGSYADSWGGLDDEGDPNDTLADVAMHYYETDLIPAGLANEVPEVNIEAGVDDNPNQHLVTFTIAFGISGSITNNPTDRAAAFSWPDPDDSDEATVDDMRHAAWNGRGQFLSAADPQGLITQMQAAIAEIEQRTNSAAAAASVAINSGHHQSTNRLYQAKFNPVTWSGELAAVELTATGLGAVQWQADTILDDRVLDLDPRTIITYNGTQGVNFNFPTGYYSGLAGSDLSQMQVDDLLHDAPHSGTGLTGVPQSENIAYGEKLVAYLKGSSADEGTLFRFRAGKRLGDIIHSSPRYVGTPYPLRYPDYIEDVSYRIWANGTVKNRTPMIYIGSNDGMLHAFEAGTGRERFAYIPQAVFSTENEAGLHWLADKDYRHRFYVDETPTAMDVFIANPPEAKKWRTVLVGGLRAGGKALYALDVTYPDDFNTTATAVSKVLWEFSHADLGYTFSRPAIVKLNNGDWAAIFGNGYNNDPNGDGQAKLFIVNLATGALVGGNPLTTNVGSMENNSCADPDSDCNGLATPAVIDTNGDSKVDRVYAGDLKGNMWVFDLSGPQSSWGGKTALLFTAKDASNNPQPITTQPRLAMHPTKKALATKPNIMVYFGTGQYLANSDASNTEAQSFYAVWDSGTTTTRTDLFEQTSTESTKTLPDESTVDLRVLSNDPFTYGTGTGEHRGWFFDLPDEGERVVVTPIIYGKLVVYTTITPNGNFCDPGGSSWLMVHDLTNGGRPDFIALDVNNDGVFDSVDQVGSDNVSGIKSGNLQWQPTIIGRDRIAVPTDNTDDGMDDRGLRSGNDQAVRASWARFGF